MSSSHLVDNIFRMRARERRLSETLDSHEFPDTLRGKPLKIRQKNFNVPLAKRVQSYLGAPEYAARARKIEDAIEQLMTELSLEYAEMTNAFEDKPDLFSKKWTALIASLDLKELNALIDKHNRYYPLEANLRTDPDSGKYLMGGTVWEQKEKITKDDLIKRFPIK